VDAITAYSIILHESEDDPQFDREINLFEKFLSRTLSGKWDNGNASFQNEKRAIGTSHSRMKNKKMTYWQRTSSPTTITIRVKTQIKAILLDE
jgi:hypothetical protein